ncbi:SRSF protein kinase 2 [Phytophthora pseudosyringae]|uniref:non-specific serine/threonine protein kinase n=1 Tax=Phytophthora pseudosyringae TaxID=221518 RepID=A0A8T1WIP0_9STRA|nr:SRSF protein kinase 2 [Phytophthora pseudosyringae]
MDTPAARVAASSSSAKTGPPPAAKKSRNRKKKRRGAAPAPPAAAAPAVTPSSSPEALEEAESGSSQSVEGSNSTTRRSFSPLSGSSSQICSSEGEEEENYEEDEYSSESEEEGESSYKPGGYHRVLVGEVYNSRFEVLEKLGWGHFSTVWKCLDRQTGAMVALKVQKSARHYSEAAKDEIELLECTVHAARTEYESMEQQEAIKVVRLVDSFEHKGPNGVHVCMVFEMMGDNLLTLIKYYNYRGVPMQLVQRLTRDMMEGLAFLHDKCQIIHTDLKPENVLLSHHIPQLPKIRKSQWEAFRAMRLAQRQQGSKKYRNGGKTNNHSHSGATTSGADGTEMSKEDKKRLKNRLKKKRQKQRKQGGAVVREASVDDNIANGKMDSTARSSLTTSDSSVEKLSNNLSQLVVSASGSINGPADDAFMSNFAGYSADAVSNDSSDAARTWYHQVGQLGDEEEKDWVHLPPEFAARVMLLLPEGRVAGSKRKEREFTLSVATKSSVDKVDDHEKEDETLETSFVLRYLDHVDDDVMSSIEEQVLELREGSSPRKAATSATMKYRLWRLEFDARYTHAVLDYLEHRVEGLRFLNLATYSGLALPGFFLPKPPSNEDSKSAAKAKTKKPESDDEELDIVIQGINLHALTGSGLQKTLGVKPLQQRLGRWAGRFNKLAKSEMFNLMKLDGKICDLGNACWTTKHFTNDIQTRQYRCPEVILGRHYDTSADIWSMACFVFELLTGDLLFDPKSGRNFNRDEDHIAQMIELLGRMPKAFTGSQRGLRDFFNRKGDLKRIRNLKFWSLQQVLMEKYHFLRHDAECFASFMGPMLRYDPSKRASAEECLAHPWLAHVDDVEEEELADSKDGREQE